MKLKLERWFSGDNRAERHYFLKDGETHGYQNAIYLCGVNPEVVPEETEQQILKLLEPIWQKLDFGRELP